MADWDYSRPPGVHIIPEELLDLRPDSETESDLLHAKSISSEKNVWFFWHSGYANMHPYTRRNVRAWHRRFSKHGWSIRGLDGLPSSPLNVPKFLDVADPGTFPQAFVDGRIGGDHAPQHTSDLERLPLLLKYGGVYANDTVGSPDSPYEVLSDNTDGTEGRSLTNYFLASRQNNAFFSLCHQLLLALWAADGGKVSTEGMHSNPLLKGVPLMGGEFEFEEDGKHFSPEEVSKMLTDYISQGQAMTMVMGLVDEEGGWNGPEYTANHINAIEYMVGSQLIDEYTA